MKAKKSNHVAMLAAVLLTVLLCTSCGALDVLGPRDKLHEGDIRYTRSKDGKTIYAARLSWPEKPFTLASFAANGIGKDVKIESISLLGCKDECRWIRTDEGIMITPPTRSLFEDKSWPVIFRIETRS